MDITTETPLNVQINTVIKKIHGRVQKICHKNWIGHCNYVSRLVPEKRHLNIMVAKGWSQVMIKRIIYEKNYFIHLERNAFIHYTSFIPWYTRVPAYCEISNEWLRKYIYFVNYIQVQMNFTYGQSNGLHRLQECLNSKINTKNEFHWSLAWQQRFNSAIIKFEGNKEMKLKFLKLFINRDISGECIEYTCIKLVTKDSSDISPEIKEKIKDENSLFQSSKEIHSTEVYDGLIEDVSQFFEWQAGATVL